MKNINGFKAALFGGFLIATTTPAFAQMESLQKAQQLGTVIGSEAYCGLSYDHSAIRAYIEKNVDASDMSFASTLATMTSGVEFANESRSESAKVAHCAQIERSAKAQGFIQ